MDPPPTVPLGQRDKTVGELRRDRAAVLVLMTIHSSAPQTGALIEFVFAAHVAGSTKPPSKVEKGSAERETIAGEKKDVAWPG